jgi:hypothetical protein
MADRWSGFGVLAEAGIAEGMTDAHARFDDELRRRVIGSDR